jgi:hypothetical protein
MSALSDAQGSRPNKRHLEAISELVRVRRLQVPKLFSEALREGGMCGANNWLIPMSPIRLISSTTEGNCVANPTDTLNG